MSQPSPGAVLVTGASTGIGAHCARYLAERGFSVFAGVRQEADADRIQSLQVPGLRPVFLDVTDGDSIAAAHRRVSEATAGTPLTGLVNNAGISVDEPMEFVEIETLRRQLEVNAIGTVRVTQAFVELLRAAPGRIVNVGSLQGRVATAYSGPYCMSKFALEAFTDCLRQELVPWGVHVSIVEPGAIQSEIWTKGHASDWSEAASPRARELYGESYAAFRAFNEKTASEAIGPEATSRAIHHALTARSPRTRYLVGTDAKVFGRLSAWVPDRLGDWMTRKVMGI